MIVSKMLFLILPGIFGLLGLLCYSIALRKPTAGEKMNGKELPPTGRGSKWHYIYIAFVLWILALVILVKSLIKL